MSDKPKVEVLPIELGATPDLSNVNKHTQRGSTLVGNSLQRRGAFRSIASAGKGVDIPTVYAGNLTLEKAVEAGFKEIVNVHVRGDQLVNVVRDDVAPGSAEAIALGLEDNESAFRSYSPEIDILAALAAGDSAILASLRKEDKIFGGMLEGMGLKEETEIDEEPISDDKAKELQIKWGTEFGQLWQVGKHRIMCGSSTDREQVERLMNGEQYQSVVTSPPYFLERSYEHDFSPETAKQLIADVAKTWLEFCKDGGYFFDNFAGIQGWEIAEPWAGIKKCEYPAALFHYPAFINSGWKLYAERIWVKPHAMRVGLWVLSTNRPVFSWEYLWTFRKGDGKTVLGPSELRCRGVWDTSKPEEGEKLEIHKLKELGHDASYPVILPKWAILVHSSEGELIGEPFCGTGTTIIASELTGRRCYGMELEPKWVATSLERMSVAFPGIEIEKI